MIIFREILVMIISEIRNKLVEKNLKVTPQRVAILEAIITLKNHPTAENIIDFIRSAHPNIATATVYKVLDTMVVNDLIKKVKTDSDVMRYDAITENHHHVYCTECDLIEDYIDEDLDKLLKDYFTSKKIAGFKMEDVVVQIRGKFDKC